MYIYYRGQVGSGNDANNNPSCAMGLARHGVMIIDSSGGPA